MKKLFTTRFNLERVKEEHDTLNLFSYAEMVEFAQRNVRKKEEEIKTHLFHFYGTFVVFTETKGVLSVPIILPEVRNCIVSCINHVLQQRAYLDYDLLYDGYYIYVRAVSCDDIHRYTIARLGKEAERASTYPNNKRDFTKRSNHKQIKI